MKISHINLLVLWTSYIAWANASTTSCSANHSIGDGPMVGSITCSGVCDLYDRFI